MFRFFLRFSEMIKSNTTVLEESYFIHSKSLQLTHYNGRKRQLVFSYFLSLCYYEVQHSHCPIVYHMLIHSQCISHPSTDAAATKSNYLDTSILHSHHNVNHQPMFQTEATIHPLCYLIMCPLLEDQDIFIGPGWL